MFVTGLRIKAKRLQNHCDSSYSDVTGCLSEAIGSERQFCKKRKVGLVRYPFPYVSDTLFAPNGAPEAPWPKSPRHARLGSKSWSESLICCKTIVIYSILLPGVCLSEAIGSKQKCSKTIVIYSILLPGRVCQKPLDQSKKIGKA